MSESTTFQKICTVCGQSFPYTAEFFPIYKSRGKRCLRGACRPCWRAGRKAHNDATREQDRQRRRNWRQANPDKVTTQKKRSHERNREHDLARSKRWRDSNLEHAREVCRDAYYQDRGKYIRKAMLNTIKRMARKRNLPDMFTDADWQRALEYFGGCCAICGRPAGLWHTIAMDHWIPLSAHDCPGTVASNIIPLCHGIDGCNNSKGNRNPVTWLTAKLGKTKAGRKLVEISAYLDSVRESTARLNPTGDSRALTIGWRAVLVSTN